MTTVGFDDLIYTWGIIEAWTVRICLFFGALTILPYVMILFIDCLLYLLGLLQFPLVALRQLRSRHASTNYTSSGETRSRSSTPGEVDALLVDQTEEMSTTTTTTVTTTSSNIRKRTMSKSGNEVFSTAMATTGVDESDGGKAKVG